MKSKKVILFDEISANPRLSEVRRGICLGKTEGVESIIGFGGGSAMDAAKAITPAVSGWWRIMAIVLIGAENRGKAHCLSDCHSYHSWNREVNEFCQYADGN